MEIIRFGTPTNADLRNNLDELYALRLFFDHLYPQPSAAPESESLSGFAAQPDRGVEAIALPSIDDEAEWDSRANTR